MLVTLLHHWWSGNDPLNLKHHLNPECLCMTLCCCWVRMGMGVSTYCWVAHFSCMQNVLSGANSIVQCSSSRGTVWKSSSLQSEDSGEVVLELIEVSMLSSLKVRWHHTDPAGECVRLQVTGLHGVLCTGLKEACSKLYTWCMCGILCKGVGTSSLEPLS